MKSFLLLLLLLLRYRKDNLVYLFFFYRVSCLIQSFLFFVLIIKLLFFRQYAIIIGIHYTYFQRSDVLILFRFHDKLKNIIGTFFYCFFFAFSETQWIFAILLMVACYTFDDDVNREKYIEVVFVFILLWISCHISNYVFYRRKFSQFFFSKFQNQMLLRGKFFSKQ